MGDSPRRQTLADGITGIRTGRSAGEPLMLLHGGGLGVDAATNFSPVLIALAEDFDCVAPDLVGFGDSVPPSPLPRGRAEWSEVWCAQVATLTDSLGLTRPHLVGNSAVGGMLALDLAAREPDAFATITILAGAGVPAPGEPEMKPLPSMRNAAHDTADTRRSLAASLEKLTADRAALGDDFDRIIDARLENLGRPWAVASFDAIWDGPPPDRPDYARLAAVGPRMQFLHGSADGVADRRRSEALAAAVAGSRFVEIDGAGHWITHDRPQQFVGTLKDFIAGQAG